MHTHNDGDEVIYVIKGAMRVVLEGETGYMKQGDGILIKSGDEHQLFNDSDTEELLHTFTFHPPDTADAIASGYGRDPEKFVIHPPEKSS
jgi:quercetin dioxygenase-like cupin family protein